jgi:CBS domain-containing protein
MNVREMMQRDVITATPEMSLSQVRQLMHDKQIRHVPVVAAARVVGIITDRDVLEAMPSPATTLSQGEIRYQLDTISIASCMTREVVMLTPDDEMVEAARLLTARRFGCVPVVDAAQLVGIVTEIDCLRVLLQLRGAWQEVQVKEIMEAPMITVMPEDVVRTAHQRMQGGRVRHLPVLDDTERLVGVITDRDIRRAGASDAPHLSTHELSYLLEKVTVREIMTTQVYTVAGTTTIPEAGERLLAHKFGCLPVTRHDGTLEGMLTVTDLLRCYIEQHDTASG